MSTTWAYTAMRADELYQFLAPFGALVNRGALSNAYKALRLSTNKVRGCAVFGSMEAIVDHGLDADIAVDGEVFLQLLKSLPPQDLQLSIENGAMQWRCGAASGRLPLLGDPAEIPSPPLSPVDLVAAGQDFVRGLRLGSLSCGTTAMSSVGLYGVAFSNNYSNGLMAYSSDNVTLSSACLSKSSIPGPELITLSPECVKLLAQLAGRDDLLLGADKDSVYCQLEDMRCMLKQVPPLGFDIPNIIKSFLSSDIRVGLNREIIGSFIRRAEALSEERGQGLVSLSVVNGEVRLAFEQGRASSEEYYVVEGADTRAEMPPISVDSRRLGQALSFAEYMVFDHIAERGALVMRGDPDFVFVISART